MVLLWRVVMVGVLLVGRVAPAQADQATAEREIQIAKALFDAGKLKETLERAETNMPKPGFTDAQRVELHRLAALAAFNLSDLATAKRHFLGLLQLDPDHVLDPFAVPPPAIAIFEELRSSNAANLDVVRQLLAYKAEQERKRAAEEAKQKADTQASGVLVRTVERHHLLLNLVPFGVPQFLSRRVVWGTVLAVTQGLTAVASLASFFVLRSLPRERQYPQTDRLKCPTGTEPCTITVRGIPANQVPLAQALNITQVAAGAAFYAVWLLGAIEAFARFVPETITDTKQPSPTPRLSLTPNAGGLGFSLGWTFD